MASSMTPFVGADGRIYHQNSSVGPCDPPWSHGIEWLSNQRSKLTKEEEDFFLLNNGNRTFPVKGSKLIMNYKGITFEYVGSEEIKDFFKDLLNLEKDEILLLQVTHPEIAKTIKSLWVSAWKNLQAEKAFYE